MNGPQRVLLQIQSNIREIIADIDQLKLYYSMSAIEILTPRAEVMLRSGKKSKVCLKACYKNINPSYSITLQYPLEYPYEPLEIVNILYVFSSDNEEKEDGDMEEKKMTNEELVQQIQQLGQEYSNAHIGEKGYSVELIEYLKLLLAPLSQSPSTSASSQQELSEAAINNEIIPTIPQEIPQPYKCRQCRHILFYSCHIEHNPIHQTASSTPSSTSQLKLKSKSLCTSIFLQEVIPQLNSTSIEDYSEIESSIQWLQQIYTSSTSSDGNSGKILCPSCQHKVGYWSWSGAQCSCGIWFIPSLQFTVAKIDPPIILSSKNMSIVHPTSYYSLGGAGPGGGAGGVGGEKEKESEGEEIQQIMTESKMDR